MTLSAQWASWVTFGQVGRSAVRRREEGDEPIIITGEFGLTKRFN